MANREEYIDKLEKQLREWNSQIDELENKAKKQSEEVQAGIFKRVDELKAKRAQLNLKLSKIKNSGEEAFENIKGDAETLWNDLKLGFSEIREIIKN